MTLHQSIRRWLACAPLALLPGCVAIDVAPDDLVPEVTAAESNAPLGGEALAQRRLEMRRAYGDMVHFHATLESLKRRRDRSGLVLFNGFLDEYMGTHLDPIMSAEWQSRHPELSVLDANLRFAKAELLMEMRATRRAHRVIDDIERRYQGREDMLVSYPFGDQSTLKDGLEILRDS